MLLFVQCLKWDAEDQSVSFFDSLKTACRARLAENQSGRVLIGSMGNGKQVTYALPQGASDLTPSAIASLCGELLRRYNEAKADLIAGGNATPTDEQIYDELVGRIQPITQSFCDFSEVRNPCFPY